MKFEIKPAGDGKFCFEMVADNGEVIAVSKLSYSKFDILQRIKLIQSNAKHAAIEGLKES